MAKDKFYRTKPHVNVSTVIWLKQLGFMPLGALQVASGEVVTDPQDRARMAQVLGEFNNLRSTSDSGAASGSATGKRQHKPIKVRGVYDLGLEELGFSILGVQQIATGQIVTDPQDRGLVAEIFNSPMTPLIAKSLCKNE